MVNVPLVVNVRTLYVLPKIPLVPSPTYVVSVPPDETIDDGIYDAKPVAIPTLAFDVSAVNIVTPDVFWMLKAFTMLVGLRTVRPGDADILPSLKIVEPEPVTTPPVKYPWKKRKLWVV
jgi:hypothetical protein